MNPKSKRLSTQRLGTMRRSSGQRGAAMVEAAVVLPVLVTFLGMMVMFHNLFESKQDAMLTARGQMLSYASHACGGQAPPSDGSSNSLASQAQQAKGASGKVGGALSLAFRVESRHAEKAAKGQFSMRNWGKTLMHDSYSMCNERRLDGGLKDLIPFGVQMAKGML